MRLYRLAWVVLLAFGAEPVGVAWFPHPLVEVSDVARFEPAIQAVLKHEGGYVNDPKDPGGETNFGISKRSHPDVDVKALTPEKAADIYREKYWEPGGYERIEDQRVATKTFDLAVNMGSKPAHILLQRAVRAASGRKLTEDGVLGPMTFAAVNDAPADSLLAALRSEAAGHYRILVTRNTNLQRFVEGWLNNRAYGTED